MASSVPATEHSVMTAWATEKEAIDNMLEHFGGGLFSVVMDSYDYAAVRSCILQSLIVGMASGNKRFHFLAALDEHGSSMISLSLVHRQSVSFHFFGCWLGENMIANTR